MGRKFEPGKSGNPNGRPFGSRNKATLAAEALLEGEAEVLTRLAIDKAKGGDMPMTIFVTVMATPITSAGRFSPFGPLGIGNYPVDVPLGKCRTPKHRERGTA